MTKLNIEQQRREFEAAVENKSANFARYSGGAYKNRDTENVFQGWLLAKRAAMGSTTAGSEKGDIAGWLRHRARDTTIANDKWQRCEKRDATEGNQPWMEFRTPYAPPLSKTIIELIKDGQEIDGDELIPSNATDEVLLRVIADIRHKTGVGDKPMLSELADAIVGVIESRASAQGHTK